MKLRLPEALIAILLTTGMAHTAQATITASTPYSITLEDGTTYTAAAEIPGEGDNPATPAVTLKILTCDNPNTNVENSHTGATYTVLASTASSDTTYGKGRFYIDSDDEATRINNMGTLIIANGTWQAAENGTAQNFYGGQLKLVGKAASNDIIIGSETYTENWTGDNVTDEQRENYSTAIQLTNNAKLTGSSLTLAADSQIGVEGTNSKGYIENAIRGEGKSLELLSDKAGNTISLSGGATLKTVSGAANVVLDDKKSNNSTAAGSTAYTINNIIGDGTMTIDSGVTLTLLGDTTADGATVKSTKDISLNGGTLKLGDDGDTQRYITLSGDVSKTGNPDILIRKKVEVSVEGSFQANKIKFGQKIDDNQINSEATLRIKDEASLTAATDLDMTNGTSGSKAKVIFENGSTGSVQNLWMGIYEENSRETYVEVAQGATLTLSGAGVTISGSDSTTAARITRTSGNSGKFTTNSNGFTISKAKITVDKTEGKNLSLELEGKCSLENAIAETISESNNANTSYSAVEATEGNIEFLNKGTTDLQIDELTIEEKKSVSVHSGSDANSALATLTVGTSLTAGNEATLNGNLKLADKTTLNLSSALTMGGTLTLGSEMLLDGALLTSVSGLTAGGKVDLFKNVTGLLLNEATTYNTSATADALAEGQVALNTYFTNVQNADIYLAYNGTNVYAGILSIPEPATATLSLLALAGLAARRRRK